MCNYKFTSNPAFFYQIMYNCHFYNVLLQGQSPPHGINPTFVTVQNPHIGTPRDTLIHKTPNKMKRIFIFLLTAFITLSSNAQIFDFGFPDPFSQRQRVQQTPVTPPEYKGGNQKLNKFIEKNFCNPKERKNIDGKITVACIIGTKGKVIEAQVVRGLDEYLNSEALRVAKKLKFKPAVQGKKKVKSRFDIVFPIRRGRLSFLDLPTTDV